MNVDKTNIIVVSRKDVRPHAKIYFEGKLIEKVSRFTDSGQLITEDGKFKKEINRQIGEARAAFNNMKTVLCCPKLPLPSRIRLLKCYVWSVVFYGEETWSVNQISKKRLETFEMWAMCRVMRISWTERMSNERVMTLAGV